MHALRHAYTSVLLDSGEDAKAVNEYLGHADPANPQGVRAPHAFQSGTRSKRYRRGASKATD